MNLIERWYNRFYGFAGEELDSTERVAAKIGESNCANNAEENWKEFEYGVISSNMFC